MREKRRMLVEEEEKIFHGEEEEQVSLNHFLVSNDSDSELVMAVNLLPREEGVGQHNVPVREVEWQWREED